MKHLTIRHHGRILDKVDIAVIISLIYDIPFSDKMLSDMSYRSLGDMLVSALRSGNTSHILNRKVFHYDISNFLIPPYYL